MIWIYILYLEFKHFDSSKMGKEGHTVKNNAVNDLMILPISIYLPPNSVNSLRAFPHLEFWMSVNFGRGYNVFVIYLYKNFNKQHGNRAYTHICLYNMKHSSNIAFSYKVEI